MAARRSASESHHASAVGPRPVRAGLADVNRLVGAPLDVVLEPVSTFGISLTVAPEAFWLTLMTFQRRVLVVRPLNRTRYWKCVLERRRYRLCVPPGLPSWRGGGSCHGSRQLDWQLRTTVTYFKKRWSITTHNQDLEYAQPGSGIRQSSTSLGTSSLPELRTTRIWNGLSTHNQDLEYAQPGSGMAGTPRNHAVFRK